MYSANVLIHDSAKEPHDSTFLSSLPPTGSDSAGFGYVHLFPEEDRHWKQQVHRYPEAHVFALRKICADPFPPAQQIAFPRYINTYPQNTVESKLFWPNTLYYMLLYM